MRVQALMFASLRDIVGARSVQVELGEGATVADLSRHLVTQYPPLGERLSRARVAVNEALVEEDRTLAAGDEVAYLPAVSGGSGPLIAVIEEEISIDRVLSSVRRHDCGAVVLFLGTVRDNFQGNAVLGMEYEAHLTLAEQTLRDVAAEAQARWPVKSVSIVHRVGHLALGEVSVAVAVASPHRAEAFEAGRFAIDRLKEIVPIWKKEHLEDGEVWIEGDERIQRRSVPQ